VATLTVTPVADTPLLSVVNSVTQLFNTNWESVGPLTATANDTNNATHAKGTAAIEGWTLTTPGVADTVAGSGGTQVSEFYFNADGDKIFNSTSSTFYTAAGMLGSDTGGDAQRVFLHLDNAANGVSALNPNYQTPAITRTINVTDVNHVYQLSLNYAPDAAPIANTGFQVLVDGAVVGTYAASAVNSALVWQAVRTGFNFATTGNHTITIRTTSPEAGNGDGVGGYFDDIRLIAAQGALQDNYLSANYGTVTRISLAGQITAGLVDSDGSEALALVITNMPGGSRIVSGATTYSPINGQVTIPYSALAAGYLMFPEDYSGRVDLGVKAISTESLNGATAFNAQTLTFHIFAQGMSAGDPPLMAVVNDTTIVEGDYAMFDIRLGAQTGSDVTVTLVTSNGTATGADYGAAWLYRPVKPVCWFAPQQQLTAALKDLRLSPSRPQCLPVRSSTRSPSERPPFSTWTVRPFCWFGQLANGHSTKGSVCRRSTSTGIFWALCQMPTPRTAMPLRAGLSATQETRERRCSLMARARHSRSIRSNSIQLPIPPP